MHRIKIRLIPWSSLKRPFFIALGMIVFYIILLLANGGFRTNGTRLVIDLMICGGGFLFWTFFFAQFILPLRSANDRLSAFERLFSYIFGFHGPAVHIKNGEIIKRKQEMQRWGPGVILLDAASGAVLRSPTKPTRAVGPGVIFTGLQETIAGSVDLRTQKKSLGPRTDENPFAVQGKKESDAEYQARQNRRFETRAFTRDGIEVVPTIIVKFSLQSDMGSGFSPWGFTPSSVRAAVLGQKVNLNASVDSPERVQPWNMLPVYMAADLWKEYVQKFTLEELFQLTPKLTPKLTPETKNGLSRIKENINQRMTEPPPEGLIQGRVIEHREFQILNEHGIHVKTVMITNLKLPQAIENKFNERWQSTWLARARQERDLVNQARLTESETSRKQALLDLANGISAQLTSDQINASSPIKDNTALRSFLSAHIQLYTRNPHLQVQSPDAVKQLEQIMEWLEGYSS
ncbi:MAG: hypothetical protein KA046_04300 [Longilinea sp.]|nr:hypothetical protein [Longilinea sp.]